MLVNKTRILIIWMIYFLSGIFCFENAFAEEFNEAPQTSDSMIFPLEIIGGIGLISAGALALAASHHGGSNTTPNVNPPVVNNTTINFVDVVSNTIFVGAQHTSEIITVQNIGPANWSGAKIAWLNTPLAGISITNDTCTNSNLAPGATCTFTLVTNPAIAVPGSVAVLRGSGINITPVDNNVIVDGNLSIALDQAAADRHLGYRAVEVTNGTVSNATLVNVTNTISNNLDGKVQYCAPTDTSCAYKTSSNCVSGGVLNAHASCLIWFKALSASTISVTSGGTIATSVDGSWAFALGGKNKIKNSFDSRIFNVAYDTSLYAGGDFNSFGVTGTSHIAKWNGTAFSSLDGGITGTGTTVLALALANGDLYAGGTFVNAGTTTNVNNIARWDGSVWNGMDSGITTTNVGQTPSVTALTTAPDGSLYVAGKFTTAGPNILSIANNIAKWSGTAWSVLDGGIDLGATDVINCLATLPNGILFAGGKFTSSGATLLSNLGEWNGSAWSNPGGGVNNTVNAMTIWNNALYIGGIFTASGSTTLNSIARWDVGSTSWVAVGSGLSGATVNALSNLGNNLYAGGSITIASNSFSVVVWDGINWNGVGPAFVNPPITSLTNTSNGFLYAVINSGGVSSIIFFDGSNWNLISATTGMVRALLIAPSISLSM